MTGTIIVNFFKYHNIGHQKMMSYVKLMLLIVGILGY